MSQQQLQFYMTVAAAIVMHLDSFQTAKEFTTFFDPISRTNTKEHHFSSTARAAKRKLQNFKLHLPPHSAPVCDVGRKH